MLSMTTVLSRSENMKPIEPNWIHGDCIKIMSLLDADSYDVVVTSPPYNIKVDYNVHEDDMHLFEYLEWSRKWMAEVFRVLRPGGSFFLNISGSRSDPGIPLFTYGEATNLDFKLQNEISWVKSIYIEPDDYADSVAQSVQKNITGEEIGSVLGATLVTLSKYLTPQEAEAIQGVAAKLQSGKIPQDQAEQVARRLTSLISKIVKTDRSDVPYPYGATNYNDSKVWEYHRRQRGHTFGHVKPIQSDNFLNGTHEFIFHFVKPVEKIDRKGVTVVDLKASFRTIQREVKGVGVPFVHPSNYCRWKGVAEAKVAKKRAKVEADDGLTPEQKAKKTTAIDKWADEVEQREQRLRKCGGNTWHIRYDTIQFRDTERANHPAVFPIGLPERCLRLHGVEPGMRVLDPFGGIGTTALACKKITAETGVPIACTIMEFDKKYLDAAVDYYEAKTFDVKSQILPLGPPDTTAKITPEKQHELLMDISA